MNAAAGLDVEYHLSLWAALSRQTEKVGFYTRQPWYVPAGYRESHPEPTGDDLDMAERVGRVVLKIAQKEPRAGQLVKIFYGAYPGAAHMPKRDRLNFIKNELGFEKREMYRELDRIRNKIEGAIEYA